LAPVFEGDRFALVAMILTAAMAIVAGPRELIHGE
jgi:hypothetical protein